MLKKLTALALVIALALSLTACSATKAVTDAVDTLTAAVEPAAEAAPAETATAPGEAIAVKVGEETATCAEVESMYDYYVTMYQQYGMPAPTADADIESMQDSIVDSLAENLILIHKAKEQGCVLTEAQQTEINGIIGENRAELVENYKSGVSLAEGATEEEIEAAAVALINAEITAYYGYDMTLDRYLDEMRESYESSYMVENLEAAVKAGATVTEEDVKATYDTYLAADKEAYGANAAAYLNAVESYEKLGGRPVLFAPEGYVRVKALTVFPKTEIDAGYEELRSSMNALEAEYGALVLGGYAEETRVSEIETEYAGLKAKADVMYEAYTEEAYAKIQTAYEELETGAAFDTVFAANNEDTDYTTYAAFGEKGRLMMVNEDDGIWDEALRDAATELSEGRYSEPVDVDGTFYILYMVGEEPAGECELDNVRSEIEAVSLAEHAETLWAETMEGWMNDTSLITFYPENYRYVGKNA